MGDAMGERVGLARTGAGDDQQRRGDDSRAADAMFDGPSLFDIEFFEMRGAQEDLRSSRGAASQGNSRAGT